MGQCGPFTRLPRPFWVSSCPFEGLTRHAVGPTRGLSLPYLYYNRMANVGKFIIVQVYYNPFTPVALNGGTIDKAMANEGAIGSAGALLIASHGGVGSSIVRPNPQPLLWRLATGPGRWPPTRGRPPARWPRPTFPPSMRT